MHRLAAERVWYGISPSGVEGTVVLRIGIPEPQPHGDWTCTVSLGSLDSETHTIYGIDAWQTTQLAMDFVFSLVSHRVKEGWQLFWERGGESATPEDLRSSGARGA